MPMCWPGFHSISYSFHVGVGTKHHHEPSWYRHKALTNSQQTPTPPHLFGLLKQSKAHELLRDHEWAHIPNHANNPHSYYMVFILEPHGPGMELHICLENNSSSRETHTWQVFTSSLFLLFIYFFFWYDCFFIYKLCARMSYFHQLFFNKFKK